MPKETKAGVTGEAGAGTGGDGTGAPPNGDAPKAPKADVALQPERIFTAEPSERQMFADFMLAVAGRDDSNYKTAPKIADDAAALTAEYFKRAGQFKG